MKRRQGLLALYSKCSLMSYKNRTTCKGHGHFKKVDGLQHHMATLNTSSHGPSISKSYQSIINAPNIPASKSSTYGHWAVFSVSAPLANAFQQDLGAKESVLKVQATGGSSTSQEPSRISNN